MATINYRSECKECQAKAAYIEALKADRNAYKHDRNALQARINECILALNFKLMEPRKYPHDQLVAILNGEKWED